MLSYYQYIIDGGSICSVDMVRLRLDFSSEERITTFGNWLSGFNMLYVEQYPVSSKNYAYRNLFQITCSNNCTFVIGLGFNGSNKDSFYLGFIEFNPNKVASEKEFRRIFYMLRSHCFCAEIVRWDLAVDVAMSRDRCILCKDRRKYTLVQNSNLDKTEYLGQRNKSGYVKLYNKTLESDLDNDLTRLEITVDGDMTYTDFVKILPRIDVKGDQQKLDPYISSLNATDLVLYELLMKCDIDERKQYIKRMSRIKRNKLLPFLQGNTVDSDRFIVSKESFRQLKHQLREWTIGIKYDLRANLEDY